MNKAEWDVYWNILNQYSPELAKTAYLMKKDKKTVLFQTTVCITAPILFAYVSWVLLDAATRKIKRLYFLARDGYVMFQIAEILCQQYRIPLQCRYLYASRMAWRLPQYHLIKEECMENICLNGTNLTLHKILERGALSEAEQQSILTKLRLKKEEAEKTLCKEEIVYYKEKLIKQTKFLDYVFSHSKEAYQNTIGYLKQEGLLTKEKIAVVDAGWMGSLQKSLSCLLESQNRTGPQIEGYYFGMLGSPYKTKAEKKQNLKTYHAWYFQAEKGIKRKVLFSHNLFECMCCAKDGMTVGYRCQKENGRYLPVFASDKNLNAGRWDMDQQIDTIRKFTETALLQIKSIKKWECQTDTKKMTEKLCRQFMTNPTKEQADYYGRFLFSDDITEKHIVELAPVITETQIRQNSVWNHIKNRICPCKAEKIEIQPYWMEGTLVRSGCRWKYWRKQDYFFYKFLLFYISEKIH